MFDDLIKIAAIALVGYFFWQLSRPRYTVKIVVDGQGIRRHEGLPKACERPVLDFLVNDLSLDRKVTICALRMPNGYLRLDIKGNVDAGTRQRIRNFFMTVL